MDAFGNYQRGTWIPGEKVKMIHFSFFSFYLHGGTFHYFMV